MTRMKKILTTLAVGASLVLIPALSAANPSDTNHVAYWEAKYPGSTCYKWEGDSNHGVLRDEGRAVKLHTFKADWPGDFWSVIVVKGGDGFTEYPYPTGGEGVLYTAPVNGGGQVPQVSHWIVCKGTDTPEPTVTPTVTPDPTPTVTPDPTPTPTVDPPKPPPVIDPPTDNPPPVITPPVDTPPVPPVVVPPAPPGVTVHPFADGYNHPSPVELG